MPAGSQILPNFNFRVTLRRSAQVEAGSEAGAAPKREAPAAASAASPSGPEELGNGGFQECSGLEVEMDVQEYLEGGRNDGVIRRVGRAKYTNIVLKRGIFSTPDGTLERELWDWLQGVVSGRRPVARYDGIIEVLDRTGKTVMATWLFDRGLPAKIRGPELNAKTGDIAIEELHIAHEGLRLGGG